MAVAMAEAWSLPAPITPATRLTSTTRVDRSSALTEVASHDPGLLYRELAPAVLGYLRAQGAPEPEDLMAEVFVQVVRDVGRFRGDEVSLRRWLFSIAHNRLIDDRRRRARRPVVTAGDPPEGAGLADPPDHAELDPQLTAALAALTPDQRSVVVLRFVADLPTNDVARIIRRRPGAVRALQHRALARLGALLGTPSADVRS
jgi:RNA polymerase sigma-70 factor, ECF subfamily